jgi:hypothetical protein
VYFGAEGWVFKQTALEVKRVSEGPFRDVNRSQAPAYKIKRDEAAMTAPFWPKLS